MKILVVDDIKEVREGLVNALRQFFDEWPGPLEVVAAVSVADAKAKAAQMRFDAAIVDLMLPEQEGQIQAARQDLVGYLCDKWPGILVIQISGHEAELRRAEEVYKTRGDSIKCLPRVDVAKQAESLIKSKIIRDQIQRMLGGQDGQDAEPSSAMLRHAPARRSGASGELEDLIADIRAFWKVLTPEAQELVREHFEVSADGQKVVLG